LRKLQKGFQSMGKKDKIEEEKEAVLVKKGLVESNVLEVPDYLDT
jgi:hypothetical protein